MLSNYSCLRSCRFTVCNSFCGEDGCVCLFTLRIGQLEVHIPCGCSLEINRSRLSVYSSSRFSSESGYLEKGIYKSPTREFNGVDHCQQLFIWNALEKERDLYRLAENEFHAVQIIMSQLDTVLLSLRDELSRGTIRNDIIIVSLLFPMIMRQRGEESVNFFSPLLDHIRITSHCDREYCE